MAYNIEHVKPAIILMLGFMGFAIAITLAFSHLDAVNHYHYVGFLQTQCYGSNQYQPNGNPDPICVAAWNQLGIPAGDQTDIPNQYNSALNETLYVVAGSLSGAWLTTLIAKSQVTKKFPDIVNIWFVVVIMATIALPDLSGWGDYAYFHWLNIAEPPTWHWLDNDGMFPFITQNITQHSGDVTLTDMYVAMSIGLILIFVLWIPIIWVYMTARKKRYVDLL